MAVVAILLMWCLVFLREQFSHHSLLFLCYINDLPENVSSKVRLYADDVLIYNTIHSKEDCLMLQEDLNSLQLWANKWQMMFNTDKCELIRITNTELPMLYDYNILEKKSK